MFYIPVTLVCVTVIISGVPLGTQMAWLSKSKTGNPFDVIRVAAVTQLAVTQGDGAPETIEQALTVRWGHAIFPEPNRV